MHIWVIIEHLYPTRRSLLPGLAGFKQSVRAVLRPTDIPPEAARRHHPKPNYPMKTFIGMVTLLLTLLFTSTSGLVYAQQQVATVGGKDVSLRLGFTAQPRFTYAYEPAASGDRERMGFGMRRFRFKTYVNYGEDMRFFSQWEGSGPTVALLDIRGEYRLNDKTWLRFGRFVGAHPRVMAITLHSDIDIIDRPGIAAVWARNTIGADARDYGAEVLYRNPRLEYRVFLANGYNQNNFRNEANNASIAGGVADKGMAISTMARYFPERVANSEFGGYVGYNRSRNPLTVSPLAPGVGRGFLSTSAHAYWGSLAGSQPFRVKLDVVSVHYEEITLSSGGEYQQNFLGGSATFAWLVRPAVELGVIVENYNIDRDAAASETTLVTLGTTYSFSAARGDNFMGQKVTLGYTLKNERGQDDPAHLLILQFQILF